MRTSTLDNLKRRLRPGRVYRREDLLPGPIVSIDTSKNLPATGPSRSSVTACTTALANLNLERLPRTSTS